MRLWTKTLWAAEGNTISPQLSEVTQLLRQAGSGIAVGFCRAVIPLLGTRAHHGSDLIFTKKIVASKRVLGGSEPLQFFFRTKLLKHWGPVFQKNHWEMQNDWISRFSPSILMEISSKCKKQSKGTRMTMLCLTYRNKHSKTGPRLEHIHI